jgi:hypothetical protein
MSTKNSFGKFKCSIFLISTAPVCLPILVKGCGVFPNLLRPDFKFALLIKKT